MQVYLVGGAVRDGLLGKPIKDQDFVVVGSTVEQMLDAGFLQVGADFPVFLHPTTKQEYALARTERKSGHGYQGFKIYASPDVTLTEDLQRRDLTINAMAIQVHSLHDNRPINDDVIDPFDGLADIKHKKLRHVSDAFTEDPLRVLRVARFYSRYADDGFVIADSTRALMSQLAQSGELDHLTPERVWQESSRALMQTSPQLYWQALYDTDALQRLCPALAAVWQCARTQAIVTTALQLSAQFSHTLPQRWSLLLSSFAPFNIINTPTEKLLNPNQTLHEAWLTHIQTLNEQFKTPKSLNKFSSLFATHFFTLAFFSSLSAEQKVALIQNTHAHKDTALLKDLLVCAQTLRLSIDNVAVDEAIDCFNAIGIKDIDSKLKGAQIGLALMHARVSALEQHISNQ